MKLSELPDIQFAVMETSEIELALITRAEKYLDRTLAKGDPVRLFLEAIAYEFVLLRNIIDFTGKQNLLAYAEGEHLDHLGILVGTARLLPRRARSTVRFHLAKPQLIAIDIPAGTRVSAGDKVFFETIRDASIAPKKRVVDVPVECTEVGEVGNGYLAGQINKIVDPLPFLKEVENITTSEGGGDKENDQNFRERIQKAPEGFSCAGPTGAYEYYAKLANQEIESVSVTSPQPGEVEIRPLMRDGVIPQEEVLAQVAATCNDRRIRPLTDKVTVLAPTALNYNLDLTYWIGRGNASVELATKEKIESAIEDFKLWQRSSMGRDLNPSELTKRIVEAGAKRVEIRSPVFQQITGAEVAICEETNVIYGGIEDE